MKKCMERIKEVCQVATLACVLLESAAGEQQISPLSGSATWEVIRIQGKDVGFSKVRRRPIKPSLAAGPGTFTETTTETHLLVSRFDQVVAQSLTIKSISSADGRLHSYTTTIGRPNRDELQTVAMVKVGELVLQLKSKGKTTQQKIPWKADYRSPTAVEESLRDSPPAENQTLRFHMFVPVYNQLAAVALTGGKREQVTLLTGKAWLRSFHSTMTFSSGATVETRFWTDERGEIMKSTTGSLQQESYRCDASRARMALQGQGFDLESFSVVKAKRMPQDLSSKMEVTYHVTHLHNNPIEIFASDGRQFVKSINERTAQIRVIKTDKGDDQRFSPDDLSANTLLQTDDPRVRSLAVEAGPRDLPPAELARTLARFVHREMQVLSTSQGFASAADVAMSMSGDCTEFAVLLAAICRVREIASRVVVGMVYSKTTRSFAYHMWTEAWTDDGWIGLDATQPDGRIGLGHLKIATTNLKGTSPYEVFLPLTQALGQIELEVVSSR